MKTKIFLLMLITIWVNSITFARTSKTVAECSISSDKNGNGKFETLLGSFNLLKYEDEDPIFTGYEEGVLQVDAFDAGYQNYAKKTTSVQIRIEKNPDENFYTIEAWGMTRNRSADAKMTLKTEALPLSIDLEIASSENETKSAQTATAQQMLGVTRLSCKKSK